MEDSANIADFTLPGFHYLGPGSRKHNIPPTNTIDAIAKEHDEAYDKALDHFKESHNLKKSVEEIEKADEKFLLEVKQAQTTTALEVVGKTVGLVGIGVKSAVERITGQTFYPDFDEVMENECKKRPSEISECDCMKPAENNKCVIS